MLSFSMDACLKLEALHEGIDFFSSITRAKFNSLNMDLFTQCMETVGKCIEDGKMAKGDIDEVVLVGGSTRIPKVRELLRGFFEGKEIKIHPDEAVAHGAALLAASLIGEGDKSVRNMLLYEVTPLSLGVEIKGELMSVVIPKNTTIPCKMAGNYTTTIDGQKAICFKVYQGERGNSGHNNLLGMFHLRGIPVAPRHVPEVIVEFEINVDGILAVCAKELSGGNKNGITMTNDQMRLTKKEIERMIEEAKVYKEEDERHKKKVEEDNKMEDRLYKYLNRRYDLEAREKVNRAVAKAMSEINQRWPNLLK